LIKKHWKAIIIVLLLVIIGGFFYFRITNVNRNSNERNISEENTLTVKKGSISKTIDGEGYISAINSENLSFPANSSGKKIIAINVDEGDYVEKGDILIELDKREAKLNLMQKENALENAKISGSSNEIEEAKLNLEIAKDQIENLSLKAPFTGLITDVFIEEGNYYENGKAVTIKDTNRLKAEINIEESNFQAVSIGQKAKIELDAYPSLKINGEVTEIANEAENNGGTVTLPVTVTLDKISQDIKINSSAEVEIIVDKLENVIVVPITAVSSDKNGDFVYKVVDGESEKVEVETGLSNGLRIVVKSALNEGDKILLNTFAQNTANSGNLPVNSPVSGGLMGGGRNK